MNALMDTILSYFRLILYPLMAFTMVVYAFSGENGGNDKSVKLHIFLAGFFMILWGTSIAAFLTKSGSIMMEFNNYGLLPTLVFILVYMWGLIIKRSRDWTNKEEGRIISDRIQKATHNDVKEET